MNKFTAGPTAPVTVYYCKAKRKTGDTVRVLAPSIVSLEGSGSKYEAHDFKGVRLSGPAFSATMIDGNSSGAAKRSGARCVLVIESGNIEGIP